MENQIVDAGLDKAIKEMAAVAEWQRLKQRRDDNPLRCPDCGAVLMVKDDDSSPWGIKLVFENTPIDCEESYEEYAYSKFICGGKGIQKAGQESVKMENPTVVALNSAFNADPNAIHALICNRIPCNQKLADDPYIPIDNVPVLKDGDNYYQVGALGLINGALEANGLPKVAVKFSSEVDAKGRAKLLGFCEYKPAEHVTPVEHESTTPYVKQE